MGLNCSGDEFCRPSDSALQGAEGYLKLVDNILVNADSMEQLKTSIHDILKRCQDNGITISKKKIEVSTCLTFAEFDVSMEGYMPTTDQFCCCWTVQGHRGEKRVAPMLVETVPKTLLLVQSLGASWCPLGWDLGILSSSCFSCSIFQNIFIFVYSSLRVVSCDLASQTLWVLGV